jgi:crotonobetainyl-CoA:carnitine CoA-transferase CaiB-like acyl-CoA transferase
MLLETSHPKAGNIKQIGNPLKFSDVTEESDAPPSLLSQHTVEILRNLVGCSDQTIKQLRKESII